MHHFYYRELVVSDIWPSYAIYYIPRELSKCDVLHWLILVHFWWCDVLVIS